MADTHIVVCKPCYERGILQICVGDTPARAYGEFEGHAREEHVQGPL